MSGGYFNYHQNYINYISEEIANVIRNNDCNDLDDWGDKRGRHYPEEVIAKFKEAIFILDKAYIAAIRIDWLLSGDDGEEQFLKRWDEDMANFEDNK